ncbi:MAG: response regulator transcription factor [Nitrosomonadales bacterium]|nr:response regulator transcription factor [Nitrosomonadales bacterium]
MKIILVDDDPVQLDKLQLVLRGDKKLEMAGAYADPRLAYDELETVMPDLLITDIGMPDMSGIELIKKSKARLPEMEIIALTAHDDMPTVFDALKAGATGYLLKNISGADMLEAITELDSGGVPITPKIARGIIANMQIGDPDSAPALSGKERDILRQISLGLCYKEIAKKMSVTTHAIHWHVKGIYKKLQAGCREEALIRAKREGLI